MIAIDAYWMGRDKRYPQHWTVQVQCNGAETVGRCNRLFAIYYHDTGKTVNVVRSGWRPQAVNDATSNAGKTSNHITAGALDVSDDDRTFAAWCVLHSEHLVECELWMEDPRWTPTWVHLQIVPPSSGKRIYRPSMAPPAAPALVGQQPLSFQPKT